MMVMVMVEMVVAASNLGAEAECISEFQGIECENHHPSLTVA